jgi:hypothetical protein
MPGTVRTTLASLVLGLCLTLAACSDPGAARECATTEGCPSGARCLSGVCVENRPPVANLSAPQAAEEFTIVALSAAASSDPDPDDAVASYTWQVRATAAPCAPPVVAGNLAVAQVRFGCAGRFAVDVAVTDAFGAMSDPVSAEIVVSPSAASSIVAAADDVEIGHRCSGDPLACTADAPDGLVALGATLAPPGAQVRWIAVPPPGLELDGTRRITFEPGPDVETPQVRLESDGVALAGDWVFRVEAFDAYGVLGAAAMRVSVTNRPPVLEWARDPLPHVFDPVASRFTAGGEIRVFVHDPDGDPLHREVASRSVNTGPASFPVVDLGDRITFSIMVPYAAPSDAAYLIGEGLERSITMAVQDVNGAVARETWPIVVENLPPVLATPLATTSAHHRFDPTLQAYVAVVPLSRWTDPEGDPLFQDGATGDLLCPEVAFDPGGAAVVACSHPFMGVSSLANLVGVHTLQVHARDPWAAAPAASSTRLEITNRAPVATGGTFTAATECGTGECCSAIDPKACDEYYMTYAGVTFPASNFVTDPDDDPLAVTSGTASQLCPPGDPCAMTLTLPQGQVCFGSEVFGRQVAFAATDGVATLSSHVALTTTCR